MKIDNYIGKGKMRFDTDYYKKGDECLIISLYEGGTESWSGRDVDSKYKVYILRTEEFFRVPCFAVEEVEENREENNMTNNLNNMFGNVGFGSVENDNIRISMNGLAIKNEKGEFVSYDFNNETLTDVTPMSFVAKGMLFKMPTNINELKKGDIIFYNEKPIYVIKVNKGTELKVLDPYTAIKKDILLTQNMFGFVFVNKLVSMMDMGGVNPMLFMNGVNNNMEDMMKMALMSNMGNINPMMLMILNNCNNK